MAWDEGLDTAQRIAARHTGSHARLLAGPGTGKSHVLMRRMVKLISVDSVPPENIFALVFTRVNARDLTQSVGRALEELGISTRPRISTLHSFALEQMLKNSHLLTSLTLAF